MRQIIYVKYNRTRSEKFQLKTAIVGKTAPFSVEKTALTEAGSRHMGSFWEKYQMIREQNPRIRFLEPEFKDGGKTVCFRYLEGETLADALADRIHMGQIPYEELEQVMGPGVPGGFFCGRWAFFHKRTDRRPLHSRPGLYRGIRVCAGGAGGTGTAHRGP